MPTKRHRIPRLRKVEEIIPVELREISKRDAPLAMVVTDYQSYLDETGKDQFGLRDIPFHAIEGQLYSEKRDMWGALDKGPLSMKDFVREVERNGDCYYSWVGKSKEEVLRSVNTFLNSHVLIDGVIYQQSSEPRYVVNTFGLGYNHGSTGLFIAYGYNPNISKTNYFNALQRDSAIAYANDVAARRGDTDSIGTFDAINIKVFMPELVRCNPNLEHGDGNPLLNTLEDFVQASSSSAEAGILAMSAVSGNLLNGQQTSLADQIQSASDRANSTSPSDSYVFLFEEDRSGKRMGKPGDANNVYDAKWFAFYSLSSDGKPHHERSSLNFKQNGDAVPGGNDISEVQAIEDFRKAHPNQSVILLAIEYSKKDLSERISDAIQDYKSTQKALAELPPYNEKEKTSERLL